MKPSMVNTNLMQMREMIVEIPSAPFTHDEQIVLTQHYLTSLTEEIRKAQAKLTKLREAA